MQLASCYSSGIIIYMYIQFDGSAGERLCHACSVFAANQAKGDKLLKEWRRKNERFRAFIKVREQFIDAST